MAASVGRRSWLPEASGGLQAEAYTLDSVFRSLITLHPLHQLINLAKLPGPLRAVEKLSQIKSVIHDKRESVSSFCVD